MVLAIIFLTSSKSVAMVEKESSKRNPKVGWFLAVFILVSEVSCLPNRFESGERKCVSHPKLSSQSLSGNVRGVWRRVPYLRLLKMERWFTVQAKSFEFSVVEGASVLRVEERRKGFSGVVYLGPLCTAWLASTLEELLRCPWC
jgi:hypothetical protein